MVKRATRKGKNAAKKTPAHVKSEVVSPVEPSELVPEVESAPAVTTDQVQSDASPPPGIDGYYYVGSKEHTPLDPSLRTDVIRTYGLLDLAEALSRTKPDGSKGVKLRKSYKNHIADLPGKYTIPTDRTLSPIVCAPDNPDIPDPEIKPLDTHYLESLLNLEKSSINGVPGFDASLLALDSVGSLPPERKKRKPSPTPSTSPAPRETKRRHVQVRFN